MISNESQSKVTIITVTHNLLTAEREDYFRECVESVHNQTYKNIEHIVVDGASNDGTVKLIDEYAQQGWLTYISEPDSGIYDAMNKGINLATGKYIAFLNSDDFYHNPRAVELSVQALEKTCAEFSFASAKIFGKKRFMRGNPYRVFTNVPFCHQAMFACKDTLLRYGCFKTIFQVRADYELILRLFLAHTPYTCINTDIVTFRTGGISSNEVLLENERVQILTGIYCGVSKISEKNAMQIIKRDWIPFALLAKLVSQYPLSERLKFYGENLRRSMFSLRLRRNHQRVRFLGFDLTHFFFRQNQQNEKCNECGVPYFLDGKIGD